MHPALAVRGELALLSLYLIMSQSPRGFYLPLHAVAHSSDYRAARGQALPCGQLALPAKREKKEAAAGLLGIPALVQCQATGPRAGGEKAGMRWAGSIDEASA